MELQKYTFRWWDMVEGWSCHVQQFVVIEKEDLKCW